TVEETPAGVGQVDLQLRARVFNTDGGENTGKIVRDETVSGALRKETEEGTNEDTLAHTGGGNHFIPRLVGLFHFHADGLLDLSKLCANKLAVGVTLGVVLD